MDIDCKDLGWDLQSGCVYLCPVVSKWGKNENKKLLHADISHDSVVPHAAAAAAAEKQYTVNETELSHQQATW